jgi:hypothetical protein
MTSPPFTSTDVRNRLFIGSLKKEDNPLEASHGQLPETPSHGDLLRLEGLDFRIIMTGHGED